MRKFSLLLVLSLFLIAPASAMRLDLCGTGLGSGCDALFNGLQDPNYILMTVPGSESSVITPENPYIAAHQAWFGAWANDSLSRWVTPVQDPTQPLQSGTYIYRTTFTLPVGFSGVTIAGRWSADNVGSEILLNGTNIGNGSFPYPGWSQVTNFGISGQDGLFSSGLNTLDFVIVNGGAEEQFATGPTGFRVEIDTATYLTPEPAASFLVGGALLGLGALLKRRKRA